MAPKFIFEMNDVCKTFGEKVVLQDINLSFFYGAKIGVVGENGAGKSTLLKIMAGLGFDPGGVRSGKVRSPIEPTAPALAECPVFSARPEPRQVLHERDLRFGAL